MGSLLFSRRSSWRRRRSLFTGRRTGSGRFVNLTKVWLKRLGPGAHPGTVHRQSVCRGFPLPVPDPCLQGRWEGRRGLARTGHVL